MRTVVALLLSAWLGCAAAARSVLAQSTSFVGSIGVGGLKRDGTGLSMVAGVGFTKSAFILSVLPIDFTLLPHDNHGRYRTEPFDNGQSVCRDSWNGQVAASGLCRPRFVYAASVDLLGYVTADDRQWVGLGGGYRIGAQSGAYAAVSAVFGPPSGTSWNLRLRAGARIVDAAIGAAVRW